MTITSHDGNFDRNPPVKAGLYDKSMRLYCGAYEEIFKLTHCCLRANLQKHARVLIVGAGTGMEILELAPLNPNWSFCAVDPSADMLAIAEEKISEKNLPNEIQFKKGYVNELENGEIFDAATCILVMHFLKDDGSKLALLQSISKHLKHGAPLVLIDGFGKTGSIEFEKIKAAWKNYPVISGEPEEKVEKAFSEIIMKMVQFIPESRILELVIQAGFIDIFKYYTGFLYGGWVGFKK